MTYRAESVVPPEAVRLWRHIVGDDKALTPGTVTVVRGSNGLCPEGWTGVLRLGDALAIEAGEAPDQVLTTLLNLSDPTAPDVVHDALRPARTRGPGELFYLPKPSALANDVDLAVEVREVAPASISADLDAMPPAEINESGIESMDRVLVAEQDGNLLGAAGHVDWPTDVAHLGVIVAPDHRRRGVGTALGAAAARRALDHGRFPQWRSASNNTASQVIARQLGFTHFGRQFSFHLSTT